MENSQEKTGSFNQRLTRFSVIKVIIILAVVLISIIAMAFVSSQISLGPSSTTQESVAFDFDTDYPVVANGQNTPLNQISGGLEALFVSNSDETAPAFSIQSYDSTFIKLSEFSGKYLYDNKQSRDILEIRFNQSLSSISLVFATVEYHSKPSNISLTAYLDSLEAQPVGQTTASGIIQNGLYPQGKLTLELSGKEFNIVRVEIPYQLDGATNFFIDNIVVKR